MSRVRDNRRYKEAEESISRSPAAIEPAAHCYYDHDGILVNKGRLPAAAGQMFIKTIEAASQKVSEPRISAETSTVKFRPDPSARMADALTVVAESFRTHDQAKSGTV